MNKPLLLKDIIGSIISSFIDGESISAKESIDFIQNVGFTNSSGKEGDLGTIRYVSFSYLDPQASSGKKIVKIDIPLLSLIPIPYYQIDEVEIEANFVVEDAVEYKDLHTLNKTWKTEKRFELLSRIDSITSQISDKKGESIIKTKIKFRQSDIPGGLPQFLRVLENRIKESE